MMHRMLGDPPGRAPSTRATRSAPGWNAQRCRKGPKLFRSTRARDVLAADEDCHTASFLSDPAGNDVAVSRSFFRCTCTSGIVKLDSERGRPRSGARRYWTPSPCTPEPAGGASRACTKMAHGKRDISDQTLPLRWCDSIILLSYCRRGLAGMQPDTRSVGCAAKLEALHFLTVSLGIMPQTS